METIETKSDANPVPVSQIPSPGNSERSFVEALVDPVNIFASPQEVVEHPWFSDEEKRTILLSWARDELVIEQVAGRVMPDLQVKSRIDAVIEALALFDASAAGEYLSAVQAVRGNRKRTARRTLPH
ncbi:hypothetical protein GGR34_001558 [Microvirga flocculans]|uniref:Uncharacterized protein n=1 Tax=Microvirga flocculans TaxID=217168 RepID=A0A7W6IEX3_9HYPH|nr:hypothetical protein [Microvirga flocculans]MBB4039911.1 hypothetical protein [Microvirga flocculans]